jgi:hypothetical protein
MIQLGGEPIVKFVQVKFALCIFSPEWSKTRRCFINIGFNFSTEYTAGKIAENQVGPKVNGTGQLLVFA